MPLDTEDTITRLQSGSVRASIITIVVGVLSLISVFTGVVFDIEVIKIALENGITMITSLLSIYLGWRSYKGRVEAKTKIEPVPIKEEIKNLINNPNPTMKRT